MSSGYTHISDSKKENSRPPSLVDLCVQKAIDNVRYIGNVGPTDSYLLERILPHCTVEQLMHIENASQAASERDLSPITDKLWKKFYVAKFGSEHAKTVMNRLAKLEEPVLWRLLYQAKLKAQDEAQKKSLERLAQSFRLENARKQSRQIQICTKVPPAKKRSFCGAFGGSTSFSNVKSNIMKKAKVDYLNSAEMKNRAAVKKNAVQVQRTKSVFTSTNPQSARGKASISNSKFTR